ncbi:glycine cleavage system protein GcvH [Clostridiisalibacter paucivorans]|uniref:glycine cleavage system protein GcvH n=1 Tax=Clostridiisalibacter paucivorans TaxID=408753 RepID=UPI00047B1BB9|nr:glycine cleavage system protein GcvH [Clostridiisalibacter paucivorans]
MKTLKDLYYSKDHEWVKVEGDKAYIGITDFAQNALGDIVYVELPEVEDEFELGDAFGVVESVKAASDINMPIDGKIIEVNDDLEDEPELVNTEPYENWIVSIEILDDTQIDELLSAEEYEKFCEEEA